MSPLGAQCEVSFVVNGEARSVLAYPMERLLDLLRRQLGLTGAKEGCGEGECGSCAILLDGALVNSCLIPVLQAQGSKIVTIEGLAQGSQLHALQRTFLDCGGASEGVQFFFAALSGGLTLLRNETSLFFSLSGAELVDLG